MPGASILQIIDGLVTTDLASLASRPFDRRDYSQEQSNASLIADSCSLSQEPTVCANSVGFLVRPNPN